MFIVADLRKGFSPYFFPLRAAPMAIELSFKAPSVKKPSKLNYTNMFAFENC